MRMPTAHRSFVIVALLVFCGPLTSAKAQESKAEFEFTESGPQVVRGLSVKVTAYGKLLNIQSLEIDPPAGKTVQELKEEMPDPKDARQSKPGVRVWSFVVLADKDAPAGEFSVVAVTPTGRSWPRTLRTVTHVPVISSAQVVSTDSSGQVNVRFNLMDEAGDITAEKPPYVTAFLDCANYMLFNSTTADQYTPKDKKQGTVSHQFKFGSPGRELTIQPGYCMLKFSVKDDELNRSAETEVKAQFK